MGSAPSCRRKRRAAAERAGIGVGTGQNLRISATAQNFISAAACGVYRKLILRDNRLDGAVLYGDTGDSAWYAQLMRDRADVSGFRDRLMFGALPPEASVPRVVA